MLNLNDREWKEFFIGGTEGIFDIYSGKRLTTSDMKSGDRPFIGATDSNNGITNWVSNINETIDSNCLGVNYNGSVAEAFYHNYNCIFSDDVKRLHLKNEKDNKYILLFIATAIKQQKIKYTYGYKFNATRMSRQKILLPVRKDNTPDYNFMEQYIKEKEEVKRKNYIAYAKQQLKTITTSHGGGGN